MTSPPPPPQGGRELAAVVRLPGLDLMRAAAIMMVVGHHGSELLVGPPPLPFWFELGRLGVDTFFALSGFLVGGMVFRAGDALAQPPVLAGFLVGRWLRTLPLYYFILLVRQLLRILLYDLPPQPWSVVGTYAAFGQNLAWPMPAYFIESWSLAVEEWFYLLLPLLVWLGVRAGLRGRVGFGLAVTVLLAGPMLCRVLVPGPAGSEHQLSHIVVHRLDAIAWGVLAAALAANWPAPWRRLSRSALILGLGLVGACYITTGPRAALDSPWMSSLHLSVSGLGLALLLPWAATMTSIGPAWWSGTVERIARWSYSMYLTNLLVAGMLSNWLAHARPAMGLAERLAWAGLYLLGTILVSAGLWRWIEAPPLRWRKHLGVYRRFAAVTR